jgi:hypothetical protein
MRGIPGGSERASPRPCRRLLRPSACSLAKKPAKAPHLRWVRGALSRPPRAALGHAVVRCEHARRHPADQHHAALAAGADLDRRLVFDSLGISP